MRTDENARAGDEGDLGKSVYLGIGFVGGLLVTILTTIVVLAIAVDSPATDTDQVGFEATLTTEGLRQGNALSGESVFATSCVACHGAGGVGIDGLGPRLAGNVFVSSLDDQSLAAFLIAGRSADDPANTSGISMPPKGGNPTLTGDDMADVVAYLRELG